jgi:hypothetical protein
MDEKMDIMPQKPRGSNSQQIISKCRILRCCGDRNIQRRVELLPFSSVIRSARCRALINEKCPVSEESNVFCLSIATIDQKEYISTRRFNLTRLRGDCFFASATIGR